MQSVSEAFRAAVRSDSPEERILMRFADGTFFTNEDVLVNGGIKIEEAINYEEELTIGACLSSTLETTVANDHRLLSDYGFGECEVSLSVCTQTTPIEPTEANCRTAIKYGDIKEAIFEGYSTTPYLRIGGGVAAPLQPDFAVYAMLTVGQTLYCIGAEGQIWTAVWVDMAIWSDYSETPWAEMEDVTWDEALGGYLFGGSMIYINDFMTRKMASWAAMRRGLAYNAGICYEFMRTSVKRFEYVPLGIFEIDTPEKRRTDSISIQSYDRMTKFDADAAPLLASLTWPVTIAGLLKAICEWAGVPLATQGAFINSSIAFSENPISGDVTLRDILGWIAEAACAVARMTRDGELELAWFGETEVSLPLNQVFDQDVTERDVSPIDSLQIAAPGEGISVVVGG